MLTFIETFRHHQVDFLNPDPDQIDIEDIAHALSLIPRFGGHTGRLYSVAQHSVLASQLVHKDIELDALMHDAPEAYIGDVVGPLKRLLKDLEPIEFRLSEVIAKKFNLRPMIPMDPRIREADLKMLHFEAEDLLSIDATKEWGIPDASKGRDDLGMRVHRGYIHTWPAVLAEQYFLARFHELTGEYEKAMFAVARAVGSIVIP